MTVFGKQQFYRKEIIQFGEEAGKEASESYLVVLMVQPLLKSNLAAELDGELIHSFSLEEECVCVCKCVSSSYLHDNWSLHTLDCAFC